MQVFIRRCFFLGSPLGLPGGGGPVASEATTTSSRRPSTATSAPCGTCCGRCPAPRPRRTSSAPLRCTGRRSTADRSSAGCCWRRGLRWTPGIGAAAWRKIALPGGRNTGSFYLFQAHGQRASRGCDTTRSCTIQTTMIQLSKVIKEFEKDLNLGDIFGF